MNSVINNIHLLYLVSIKIGKLCVALNVFYSHQKIKFMRCKNIFPATTMTYKIGIIYGQ